VKDTLDIQELGYEGRTFRKGDKVRCIPTGETGTLTSFLDLGSAFGIIAIVEIDPNETLGWMRQDDSRYSGRFHPGSLEHAN
jgi:hypothetical protein